MDQTDLENLREHYKSFKLKRRGLNVICPICGSSIIRKYLLVGHRECINTSCPTNSPKLLSQRLNIIHRITACRVLKDILNEAGIKSNYISF
jgi:hypothetical protein